MKTTHIFIIGMFCITAFAKAQTAPTEKPKAKNNLPADGNLLDQQAQVLGNIFGDLGGVEEMKGINGYMDLLSKSDVSPELKTKLKEQYNLIALTGDPLKKKEQEIALTKMLKKALEESKNDH